LEVKGLRGLTRKENKMADITLTQRELDEIKDEERFKEKTTLLLKRIEEHQKKQNGSIETAIKSISKAYVKIASNTSAIKTYWAVLILVFGLIGVLFKIR